MIAFLRGKIHQCGQGFADMDVAGVGYRVWMPERIVHQLMGEPTQQELLVYTHHHVREDAVLLFGFLTQRDRDWFELLLGVSGIGPKVALQLMSATQADAFVAAIDADDVAALCALPGIGKKTAQRLILELRDKMSLLQTAGIEFMADQSEQSTSTGSLNQLEQFSQISKDIVEALVVLGYNEKKAKEVVESVLSETEIDSVEKGLKLALQRLA